MARWTRTPLRSPLGLDEVPVDGVDLVGEPTCGRVEGTTGSNDSRNASQLASTPDDISQIHDVTIAGGLEGTCTLEPDIVLLAVNPGVGYPIAGEPHHRGGGRVRAGLECRYAAGHRPTGEGQLFAAVVCSS